MCAGLAFPSPWYQGHTDSRGSMVQWEGQMVRPAVGLDDRQPLGALARRDAVCRGALNLLRLALVHGLRQPCVRMLQLRDTLPKWRDSGRILKAGEELGHADLGACAMQVRLRGCVCFHSHRTAPLQPDPPH